MPAQSSTKIDSPASTEKPVTRVLRFGLKHANTLFLLLSLLGCLGLLALPIFERKVKFDEKTLMLGSASLNIDSPNGSQWCVSGGCLGKSHDEIIDLAQGFAKDVHALQRQLLSGVGYASGSLGSVNGGQGGEGRQGSLLELVEQYMMHKLKLEVHQSYAGGNCTTLHGILRAPLADGKENIIIATPVAMTQGVGFGDAPPAGAPLLLSAAALLLGHLRYSLHASWLAKDIIWVVPDVGCEGSSLTALERWTRAYQAEPPHAAVEGMDPSATARAASFGRAGVMQQAIVLMADRVDASTLEVLVEGYDGQLPKLDMYNMLRMASRYATRLRAKPRAEHTQPLWILQPVMDAIKNPNVKAHILRVVSLLQFASRQAMGTPSGPHAAFKEFLVDAATAKLGGQTPLPIDYVPDKLPAMTSGYIIQFAEYLETMVRSLNNLDERFHHSYFLYLLTGPDTFVTVEIYIVPLVALIAALLAKASGLRNCMRQAEGATTARAKATGAASEAAAPSKPPDAMPKASSNSTFSQCSSRMWVSVIAAVLLLVIASVGVGAGLRCTLCDGSQGRQVIAQQQSPHQQQSLPPQLPQQHGLLGTFGKQTQQQQEQQQQQPQQQATWSVPKGQGWPIFLFRLPAWAGGRQLGIKEQATALVCLLVLASTLGWDACRLALQPNTCPRLEEKQQLASGGGDRGQGAGQSRDLSELKASGLDTSVGSQGMDLVTLRCTSLRVVMLSCVCMMLAAMASINWALGYAVAIVLVPVVAVRGQGLRQHMQRWGAVKAFKMLSLLVISPATVAALLAALVSIDTHDGWDGHLPIAKVTEPQVLRASLHMLVCQSRSTTYVMFWAALLPCWLTELGTLLWSS